MKNVTLTKKESTAIAKNMGMGVKARKEMVAYFAANRPIAEFIISPNVEKGLDQARFDLIFGSEKDEIQKQFPNDFDDDKPVFGRADGKKRIKTDLGLAMLNLVNWAKASLPKDESAKDEKPKTIDDFAMMIANAVKFAEKHNIPMDQVKANLESLAARIIK